MKPSIRKGCSFGLTSGIITPLAIADALSDAFGIHISEESTSKKSEKEIWESTIATFFSKAFFALTFIIPIVLLQLSTAIIVSLIWGLLLIVLVSIQLAKIQKVKTSTMVIKHVLIMGVVIIVTHYLGAFISTLNI